MRLLWVGKERTVESFEQFFTLFGAPLSEKIDYVCSDMWKPYLRVIRERCSNAVHILDRFHIVAKMNKAFDEVRAGEARRLAQDGYEPVLKRARWCVLKRKTNLTGKQRFRLRELLRYNLKTARAYLLKEDLQQFWEYQSATWAGKFLDEPTRRCPMCPRARLGKVRSAMFAMVALMALPAFAVADCYDLLGCSDKNDFAKHFGYLASIKSGPNCEFLWTMRNSIFAEHNYCFQTARARSAFGNENCHYNNLADVPLNRIERANVATIARAEKFKACQR